MQQSALKLREIIWEVTNKCLNGCEYCGSKDILNSDDINIESIIAIARNIASYDSVEEVNISGGDPLLLEKEVTEELIELLHDSGITVKLIMNPLSFNENNRDKIRLYDWVGISVNTKEELRKAWQVLVQMERYTSFGKKFTIITNFGIHNIWEYDNIEDLVKNNNLAWQVQYTQTDKDAIYNNSEALRYLHNKMNSSLKNNIKLIPADDMNSGPCGAGSMSAGILSNGDIVPCLSMRAWKDELPVQGNLLKESLEHIWTKGFYHYRFCEFECCKDICNAPFIPNLSVDNELGDIKENSYEPLDLGGLVAKYGVQAYAVQQGLTMLYSVQTDTSAVAFRYGVWKDK